MVKCSRCEKLLMEHFDGSLSKLERTLLDDHLTHCPHCRSMYGELSEIIGTLESSPSLSVPEGLSNAVHEQILFLPIEANKKTSALDKVIYGMLIGMGLVLFSACYLFWYGMDFFELLEIVKNITNVLYGYFIDLQIAYRVISVPFTAEIGFFRVQIQIGLVFTLALLVGHGVKMAWAKDA